MFRLSFVLGSLYQRPRTERVKPVSMSVFMGSLVLAALMLAAPAHAARSPAPALDLVFNFKPAMDLSSNVAPNFMLDKCNDESCGSIAVSAPLTCNFRNMPNKRIALALTSCSVKYVVPRVSGKAAPAWLQNAGIMRLRIAGTNQVSRPFYFGGGVPGIPPTVFHFQVIRGYANGFPTYQIVPGQ